MEHNISVNVHNIKMVKLNYYPATEGCIEFAVLKLVGEGYTIHCFFNGLRQVREFTKHINELIDKKVKEIEADE